MAIIENYTNDLHLTLKELMELKSKRDKVNFTIYQLAKALNMPHSMLIKLTHSNPSKRVNNPRVDTITRIVDFFKRDGFNITLDDFLSGFRSKSIIDIDEQELRESSVTKSIKVYSLTADLSETIGFIDVKLAKDSKNIIAFLSDEDIKPMFKKGSIFIVDTSLKPKNDNLVIAKVDGQNKVLIRKYYVQGHKKILKSYDPRIKPIELMPSNKQSILGVVIQVNAKT